MSGFEPASRNKITADGAQDKIRKGVHVCGIRPHGSLAQDLSDLVACLGLGTRDRADLRGLELSGFAR